MDLKSDFGSDSNLEAPFENLVSVCSRCALGILERGLDKQGVEVMLHVDSGLQLGDSE